MRELLEAVWFTWPPPPIPERALNMPGQQKHTSPMRITWMSGELYLKKGEREFWVIDSSSALETIAKES